MAKSRICSVEGCDNQRKAKGLCNKHYLRKKMHGSEFASVRAKAEDGEASRFLQEIALKHVGDQCLTWPYAKSAGGYGQFYENGETLYVHRRICELINGSAPSTDHWALHQCGNGHLACCSPKHVYWGSRQQNKDDELRHGVRNRGIRQGHAKLTADNVREIRRLRDQMTQKAIGERFGVSDSTIRQIFRGNNWGWLK